MWKFLSFLGLISVLMSPLAAHAAYDGILVIECANCTTVSAFSNTAKLDAENRGLAYGKYAYWVVNPYQRLIGRINVRLISYEPELKKWYVQVVAVTGTDASLAAEFSGVVGDDMPWVKIPVNVASGCVASSNTTPVTDYLHQLYQGQSLAVGFVQVVFYANGDTAKFQVVSSSGGNNTFGYVSGSNTTSDGSLLDDSCQPTTSLSTGSPVKTPAYHIPQDLLHNLIDVCLGCGITDFQTVGTPGTTSYPVQAFKLPDGNLVPPGG